MKLERLNTSHLNLVRQILEEAFPGDNAVRWNDENLPKTIQHHTIYGLFFENRLVAVAGIRNDSSKNHRNLYYLFSFAVAKGFRNRGFGTRMMELITNKLPKIHTMILNSEPYHPFLGWYRRQGFETYKRVQDTEWLVRYAF